MSRPATPFRDRYEALTSTWTYERKLRVIESHAALLAALRYLEQMATHTAHGKHNCPEIHGALAEARAAIAAATKE